MNYLYPVFILVMAVYIFDKSMSDISGGKKHWFLPPLCFFAGATTEQAGIMAAGIFFIILAAEIFKKARSQSRLIHYVSAACSLAGYITVAFAPGTFRRLDLDNAGFSLQNLITAVSFFFTARESAVFIILTTLSALFLFNRLSRELSDLKKIHACAQVCILPVLAFYIIIIAAELTFQRNIYIILTASAISIFTAYVYLLYFIIRGNILPFAFFTAAAGAQLFMSVTHITYYRTLLCSVLALLPCIMMGIIELRKNAARGCAALFLIFGFINFASVLNGYAVNYPVNQYNLAQIRQLQTCENTEFALLKPMTNDIYGWSPLHNSNTHVMQLENFYKLPPDTVYIDFHEEGLNRLYLNGGRIYTNVPPMSRRTDAGERIFCIGVRDIARALGYTIEWDSQNNAIIIITEDKELAVSPATGKASVNGDLVDSEYIIFNYKARFMIESDFYRDILGLDIEIILNENQAVDIIIKR
jgi:hypothetical protein